ncbi:MAG: L,D-transpeptidase family protein [Cryomorphaceae bacterium]
MYNKRVVIGTGCIHYLWEERNLMKSILPFFLLLTLLSLSPKEEVEEYLRRKVENVSLGIVRIGSDRIQCAEAVPRFYQNRSFQQVWTNTSDAQKALAIIRKAPEHGLNPADYHSETLERLIALETWTPLRRAEFELLMTDAYLLYTSHMISGKVNPQSIDAQWHVLRHEMDPVQALETASQNGTIGSTLAHLAPNHPIYKSLMEALTQYKSIQESGGWTTVNPGETLKPGMKNPRVNDVRELLLATGDMQSGAVEDLSTYDDNLRQGVMRFQSRHGIDADGAIGVNTLAAMNVSAEERVAQIQANLERWRWLSQQLSEYHIRVNIADYSLKVIRGNQVERSHKVMVGKPVRSTPVFSSTMQYIVLNPTWTVPPTILNNDVLPAVRKDVEYLNTKGLQVLDNNGNALDPSTIDWNSPSVKSYTYRQPAGKNNALGAVKFMFPNSFNIYLHDTPSKELFSKSERAFSSGCIRVENPLDLAKHLIKSDGFWTDDAIDIAVKSGKTQTIPIKEKPMVYLLYWTAWTSPDGLVQFRKDIYNRDRKLIEALNEDAPMALASK